MRERLESDIGFYYAVGGFIIAVFVVGLAAFAVINPTAWERWSWSDSPAASPCSCSCTSSPFRSSDSRTATASEAASEPYSADRRDRTRVAGFMSTGPFSLEAMAQGTVDFFNDTGGYGFIETEDADDDVFFHMEDIGGPDLEEGQELEFDIEQAPKGPRATNVERL